MIIDTEVIDRWKIEMTGRQGNRQMCMQWWSIVGVTVAGLRDRQTVGAALFLAMSMTMFPGGLSPHL